MTSAAISSSKVLGIQILSYSNSGLFPSLKRRNHGLFRRYKPIVNRKLAKRQFRKVQIHAMPPQIKRMLTAGLLPASLQYIMLQLALAVFIFLYLVLSSIDYPELALRTF